MTAALKFLPDEAQMLQPADITVTILKKKKERKNHDKNNPRVANNTLDRIPKLPMLDLRLHFSVMCHHIPCWPFSWS